MWPDPTPVLRQSDEVTVGDFVYHASAGHPALVWRRVESIHSDLQSLHVWTDEPCVHFDVPWGAWLAVVRGERDDSDGTPQ